MMSVLSRQMLHLCVALALLAALCVIANPPESAAWIISIFTAIAAVSLGTVAALLLHFTQRTLRASARSDQIKKESK